MDQGSHPPLLSEANSPELSQRVTNLSVSSRLTPESTPTQTASPNDDTAETDSSFNSGRKNKHKTANNESEALVNLMLKKLKLEGEQREAKEAERIRDEQRAERQELRAEKLVNIMETLVKHLTQQ